MTSRSMLKRINLSENDLHEIEEAVAEAEKKTTGEISLAIVAESSTYAFWEFAVALAVSVLMFLCLYPKSPKIYEFLSSAVWGIRPWHLSMFFFLFCSASAVVFYLLFNIPALDRRVVPESVKERCVTERALRCFAESGVYATDSHSGILVFVSYLEQQIRIVADKALNEKISDDLWNLIAEEIEENLHKGNAKSALLHAVEKCGQLLAENFPSDGERKNQLSDALLILEE